jgi:large conductance mechanosensitive channel
MPKAVSGFMDFVRSQGVVGLAVGLAIGTQVTATTKTIVDGFINPMVAFVLSFIMHNPQNLNNLTVKIAGPPHEFVIQWGSIVSLLIQLLAVAAVIYFVVKGLGFDKLDKPIEVKVTDKDKK